MKTKNRRKIGLQNFKVFKDYQEFEIAPITILTGTNSSGKSSFVKAARLLKENFIGSKNNYDQFTSLDFQLSNIHLGGFDKVFNSRSKRENKGTNKILFSTKIKNEIWGKLEVSFVYEKANIGGVENAILKNVYILNVANREQILGFYRRNVDFATNKEEKINIDVWYMQLNEAVWFQEFRKVAKEHDFQVKILKLREYIWNLALENKNNYIDIMDKKHKAFYDELLSKGISPVSSDLLVEIDVFQGFFKDDWQKDLFAYSTADEEPLGWNYSAEYFKKRLDSGKILLQFPLFDRLEWKMNFDKNGDFIDNPLSNINKESLDDFNEEMYYKISQALINKKIKNRTDTLKYFIKKEIDVFKEFYFSKQDPNNFIFQPIRSSDGRTGLREIKNKLSEYFEKLFNIKADFIEMPDDPKEIEDFVFFDNVFYPIKGPVKNLAFRERDDKNNLFAKWKPYQESLNFIIESVNTVVKDSFKSFADFSEFIFIDTQRDLNQRVFLDKDDSEFNVSMREYLHLESLQRHHSESIKFSSREEYIKKWIKKFDISQDFLIERDKEGIGTRTYLINNEDKELLVDVGFGVNKLFSLILKIAVSPKNTTIFIEEPESNLHPAMQSKLADLFVDAHQLFGHHFVLETHSEYLIRKLQFLVASEKSKAKAEDINIYYLFHPDRVPEGRKQVEKLEMREDGILKQDFGKGFFDESVMLTLELLRNQKSN